VIPERAWEGGSLRVHLEGPNIMLEACHHGEVLHASFLTQHFKQVAHHGSVDANVLGFRGMTSPGGEKNVRWINFLQCNAQRINIQKICGNRTKSLTSEDGFLASPWVVQPWASRCSARLWPTIPVTPTMSADFCLFECAVVSIFQFLGVSTSV
jgi:hypothetical protein